MRQADRVEIPGSMWQPLFRPAPIFVLARHGESFVEGDAILILEGRRDAVDDRSGSVGVLVGAEEHVSCIAMAAAHQHAHVEWISALNPVQLIPGVLL